MQRPPLSVLTVTALIVLLNLVPLVLTFKVVFVSKLATSVRLLIAANHLAHFFLIGLLLRFFYHRRRWAMFLVLCIVLGNALYYLQALASITRDSGSTATHSNQLILLFGCLMLNILCAILTCSRSCQTFFRRKTSANFCKKLSQSTRFLRNLASKHGSLETPPKEPNLV